MLVAWRILVWRSKARAGEFNHLPTFRASAPQEWQILSWLLTFLHPFYCYIGNMVVFPATNIPCDWKITFFWKSRATCWHFSCTSRLEILRITGIDCKKKKIFSRQNISKGGCALMRFEICNMEGISQSIKWTEFPTKLVILKTTS